MKIENDRNVVGGTPYTTLDGREKGDFWAADGTFWVDYGNGYEEGHIYP